MNSKKCSKGGPHEWVQFVSLRLGYGAQKCTKCGATTSPIKKQSQSRRNH